MSTNTKWNAFVNNTITTQSVQFDLTPTVIKQTSNQDPSSLLSLSNYLQYDDQTLFYHEKYPQSNQKNIKQQQIQIFIKKSYLFTQDPINNNKKSHLIEQFSPQNQDNQTMLLLDSEIKQHQLQFNQQFISSKQLLTQVISSANIDQNETKSSFLSTIKERNSLNNKHFCTQSIQLLDLLSIPKDQEIKQKLRQSIKQISKNDDQLQKMKKLLQFFSENFNKQNKQNKSIFVCTKCNDHEKRIKILQQYLDLKEKQISKYEQLIDQLNSKMFDLKIQNKRLTFENQKYLYQIQELQSKRKNINSKQRPNIITNQSIQNCSFFDQDDFGVINSTAFSRAFSRKDKSKQTNKPKLTYYAQNIQQDSYLSPSKQYPQTPIPTMTYLKPKKQRKPSNFSDHSLQISISKVKQPSIYQIAQTKIDKILKQNNIKYIEKKNQNKPQTQKSIKRFSDLLNRQNNEYFNQTQNQKKSNNIQDKNFKNSSPLKKLDFYKIKTKQTILNNNNSKNHPIYKIPQQEDNYSQSSQTKTQKFYYGTKKSLQSQFLLEQNDYNILNRKKIVKGPQNDENKVKIKSKSKALEKNQLVYKSFKEIGTQNNENSQNRQITFDQNKMRHKSPIVSRGQYGINSNIKNTQNINVQPEKNERKCFSPSPNSYSIRRQNTQRSNPSNSPHSKQNIRKTEIKSFLR